MVPLATYQATGPSVPMFFQRINDSSFETGLQPWTQSAYNNYTSSVTIVSPGYNDASAVQLIINSGNLTVDSHLTLIQDFSKNSVAFGNSMRFRAAVQVQQLQGTSATDRIEVSLTLTSSLGNITRVHYFLGGLPSLQANTTSDAYFAINFPAPTLWALLDRNVATDAMNTFPNLSGSFSSIRDARLSVYSTSRGIPTYDPRIKYWETGGDSYWNTTETVVYDPDADGFFNPATDWILYNRGGIPLLGQMLRNDLRIKFVDTNLNYKWDPGEPIVYDLKNEGVYDIALNDPVINGTAIAGSLLQDPARMQTSALFDQVELYSPAGNYSGVHNGGFESGDLTGWGNTPGFNVVSSPVNSGKYSVQGVAIGNTIGLAQSIDARPSIDSSTRLRAFSYLAGMTGTSASDRVDVWLGLVDSSPQANPLSIYYYFNSGTGIVPSNTTDTVNHKTGGFGTILQWLSLNQSLVPDTGYFNTTGHTGPYRIETVVLEASAGISKTTTANFDDVSVQTLYKPDSAITTYYAVDGLNSTYVYRANNLPQGSFYITVPGGQSVLNITSPAGTKVLASDYATQTLGGSLLITVPVSTSLKYQSFGTWRFHTTSQNALASLYATSTGSSASSSSFNTGTTINLISQSKDPLGNPLSGSNVTFLPYSSNTQAFTGKTNGQGWFNQTNIVLPSNPGAVTLEAITVSPSYIGLRTYQLTINSTIPWALIAYISIAAGAGIVFSLLLFMRRRRKTAVPTPSIPVLSNQGPKQPQTKPQKGK
jgi:hypothetical protein